MSVPKLLMNFRPDDSPVRRLPQPSFVSEDFTARGGRPSELRSTAERAAGFGVDEHELVRLRPGLHAIPKRFAIGSQSGSTRSR